MEKCVEHGAIKVEIDNIKEDVKELKDYRKLYMDTNVALEKNLTRLTILMEKQDERSERQDERLDKQDKKIDEYHLSTKEEITGLRDDMKETYNMHTAWYQNFLTSNFGKVIKFLFVIILVLLGAKLAGLDVTTLLK